MMRFAAIKYYDIANGLGVRTSLFVSGCTHYCKGCFNEVAWDFQYGEEFTQETVNQIIKSLEPSYVQGLSLLGGEPFEIVNQRGLLPLLQQVKEKYPGKDIWCYTGYRYETDILAEEGSVHCEVTEELLNYIDILVDGEFVQELYDISLKFRGSKNQRILKIHEPGCPELFPVEK